MSNTLHTEHRAHTVFQSVMESAPMGLLVCAALGLGVMGVFQFIYYYTILPAGWNITLITLLATALAIFFEALGFYFLVATVRDFSGGAKKEGWIGLLATFLLWGYALWECVHIAGKFSAYIPENYTALLGIVATITCIVRVVEFRIALTVTSAVQRKNELAELAGQLAQAAEKLEATTGKLRQLEAEKSAAEQRKQQEAQALALAEKERAQLAAEKAERERQGREAEMEKTISDLQRKLNQSAAEKPPSAKPEKPNTPQRILREAIRLTREAGNFPNIGDIERNLGISEGNVRKYFPNGSLRRQVLEVLEAEQQPADN